MKGRHLLDHATAKRVVRYANTLTDGASKMTAVERRQIADALQAEGLAVGRWRSGHLVSGLLIVGLAIMTILGAIDVDGGPSNSVARVMVWIGAIGLAFVSGTVWKLAGRAIDYPLGMYAVMLASTMRESPHNEQAPQNDSGQ